MLSSLFSVTTFSRFRLTVNYLQLKVGSGFLHLQYVFIDYQPIATEGGSNVDQ